MSVYQKMRPAYRQSIKNLAGGDKATAESVLDILYGTDWDEGANFKIYEYREEYLKPSFIQRVNLLWVIPLFLLLCPFKWIVTGEIGIDDQSKLGKIVSKLIGY